MTKDAYWDELGIAWAAINPDLSDATPQLKSRIRRQTLLFRAGFIFAAGFSLIGFLIGVWTIWLGVTLGIWNFATRGTAILIIALLAAIAAHAFWSDGARADRHPVLDTIDLAIHRARRLLLIVRLSLYACSAAAVFGAIGAVIRSYLAKPANVSPILDISFLALAILVLALYGRSATVDLAKLEYLKRAMTVAERR